MELLAPFIERRSHARLRATPLRRRKAHIHPLDLRPLRSERRRVDDRLIDIARTLELNLDRYPTKAAMLTYLQSLLYAAEANDVVLWQFDYVVSLRRAISALEASPGPIEATATLYGYQAFMQAHRAPALHVVASA
jgi:hypothetical protein